MLTEQTNPADAITVTADGSLEIREATIVLRDGEVDRQFPPAYHRYVLHPGDDLTGRDSRIADIAGVVWTQEIVEAFKAALEAETDIIASEELEASTPETRPTSPQQEQTPPSPEQPAAGP